MRVRPTALVVGWLVVTILYAVAYVVRTLNLPDLEGYEKDWQFQVLAFCFSRLPWLILALVVALVIQRSASRRSTPRDIE